MFSEQLWDRVPSVPLVPIPPPWNGSEVRMSGPNAGKISAQAAILNFAKTRLADCRGDRLGHRGPLGGRRGSGEQLSGTDVGARSGPRRGRMCKILLEQNFGPFQCRWNRVARGGPIGTIDDVQTASQSSGNRMAGKTTAGASTKRTAIRL